MERAFYIIFLFVLGGVMGSFLNVCIYRIPRGISIVRPGSRCPRCSAHIKPLDNIPILSYFVLRGKCRTCGEKISPRYVAVEALLALLFSLGGSLFEPGWSLLFALVFLSIVISSVMTDLELRIIPDRFSLTGLAIGVVSPFFLDRGVADAVAGAVAGGGSLFLVGWAYKKVRGIEGMGGGDVKMAAMIGSFLGLKGVMYTIFFASLAGSLFGLTSVVLRRGTMKTELPFGVFLGASSVVVFFGEGMFLLNAISLGLG